MVRALLIFAMTVSLGACVTRAEEEDVKATKITSLYGKTVADFISATGHTPSNATDLSADTRLFVFYGNTVTIGMPGNGYAPDVASSVTCRVNVTAKRVGHTSSASDFVVSNINEGPACRGFF